jgi:hypothetical protein
MIDHDKFHRDDNFGGYNEYRDDPYSNVDYDNHNFDNNDFGGNDYSDNGPDGGWV